MTHPDQPIIRPGLSDSTLANSGSCLASQRNLLRGGEGQRLGRGADPHWATRASPPACSSLPLLQGKIRTQSSKASLQLPRHWPQESPRRSSRTPRRLPWLRQHPAEWRGGKSASEQGQSGQGGRVHTGVQGGRQMGVQAWVRGPWAWRQQADGGRMERRRQGSPSASLVTIATSSHASAPGDAARTQR